MTSSRLFASISLFSFACALFFPGSASAAVFRCVGNPTVSSDTQGLVTVTMKIRGDGTTQSTVVAQQGTEIQYGQPRTSTFSTAGTTLTFQSSSFRNTTTYDVYAYHPGASSSTLGERIEQVVGCSFVPRPTPTGQLSNPDDQAPPVTAPATATGGVTVGAQQTFIPTQIGEEEGAKGDGTCSDGIDNDGDGRADWTGVGSGTEMLPPDPACVNATSTEYADDVQSNLIPCTNKCDLGSVMQFLNNLIEFLIKVVLFPVSIIMFVYAGYTYITAGGQSGKRVKVRSMLKHLILGMILILCAWVIVKTLLVVLGYTDGLYFFE